VAAFLLRCGFQRIEHDARRQHFRQHQRRGGGLVSAPGLRGTGNGLMLAAS